MSELLKTCGNCKHWESEYGYTNHGVKKCSFVPMLWDAFEWTEDSDNRVLSEKYRGRKAFVQDGSDYVAHLFTMADFGCNQWDEK